MVHDIPDEHALQPHPSPSKAKTSIGKSGSYPSRHKSSSHKHSRDASSSTVVPPIVEPHAGGPDGRSVMENGNSKSGRMKRSHSHSGAKLFEQLFHKRCEFQMIIGLHKQPLKMLVFLLPQLFTDRHTAIPYLCLLLIICSTCTAPQRHL